MPLNRPTFLLTLLAALTAIAALACTSSSTAPTATPSPQPTLADDAETRAAAESALLVLSDFPDAWEEQPADLEDDDDDLTFEFAPRICRKFFQRDEFPGTLFEIEINEFHGPDGETVESRVTALKSEDSTTAAFDELRQVLQDCPEPLKIALVDYYEAEFQDSSSTVTLVDFAMDSIEFPQYGDDTLAIRFIFEFEVDGEPITSFADIIDIRQGSLIGEFAFRTTDTPPDPDLARHLAQLIEPRLASAWNAITPPSGDE